MEDKSCTNEERISLLHKACADHAVLYKDAMNGKGIDRHLFGLYVACKGMGHVSMSFVDLIYLFNGQNGCLYLNKGKKY